MRSRKTAAIIVRWGGLEDSRPGDGIESA
jgi:hypothetical protein